MDIMDKEEVVNYSRLQKLNARGVSTGCLETLRDKYILEHRIGHGTYGTVFQGHRLSDGALVAIKKVKLTSEDEGIPSTSLREIGILKKLKHENIIELYESYLCSNKLYLVFEYMDTDLKKYIQLRLPNLKDIKYIKQMNIKRVLHRDLKPHNILIDIAEMKIKLADFGLSRSYTFPVKTYTHEVVTLWYRAPEILLGTSYYSSAIDIWSLGVIFTELLNGEPIFKGDSEITQLLSIFKVLGTPNESIWPLVSDLPFYIYRCPQWQSSINEYLHDSHISERNPLAADLLKKYSNMTLSKG